MVVGSPADAAEGTVLGAGAPNAVAGSYIVVLKDGSVSAQAVGSTAKSLASKHGGQVAATYSSALRGFSAKMSEPAARRLAADPSVAYVQQDMIMSHRRHPVAGALVGSGPHRPARAAAEQLVHLPEHGGCGRDHLRDRHRCADHPHQLRWAGPPRPGHGRRGQRLHRLPRARHARRRHRRRARTFGVAKGASIVGVRVLDCTGSGTTTDIVQGIDWVTANSPGPAVANMSLGGGVNTALDNAVANSIASGVTYAIAAGNSNINACNFSPARTPAAITLGATGQNDARASFSNFGTCLDLFAPGVGITSAWFSSNTATNTISGTSMASPHAAGVAALILGANPGFTPAAGPRPHGRRRHAPVS